jgi:hypothetical protein
MLVFPGLLPVPRSSALGYVLGDMSSSFFTLGRADLDLRPYRRFPSHVIRMDGRSRSGYIALTRAYGHFILESAVIFMNPCVGFG